MRRKNRLAIVKKTIAFFIVIVILTFILIFPGNINARWTYMDEYTSGAEDISNNSGDSSSHNMVLDSQLNPYIVWVDDTTGNNDIFFKYWDGSGWTGLDSGDGFSDYDNISSTSGSSSASILLLDSNDYPMIVWREDSGTNIDIYFVRWNGSSWTHADGTTSGKENISNTTSTASAPGDMKLDSFGYPNIVFKDDVSSVSEIYFTKWNGSTWVKADGTTSGAEMVSNLGVVSQSSRLALDSSNVPYVVWQRFGGPSQNIFFSKYTSGTGWTDISGSLGSDNISNTAAASGLPQIEIYNGIPYLFWIDQTDGTADIYVQKYTSGTGWTKLDGTTGLENISNSSTGGMNFSYVFDDLGRIYICWSDSDGDSEIFFKKWESGSGWTKIDGTAGTDNVSNNSATDGFPILKIDSIYRPNIIWRNYDGSQYDVYYSRWDGDSWSDIPGSAGFSNVSNTSGTTIYPLELEIGSNNLPVILWDDDSDGDIDIYISRWTEGGAGDIIITSEVEPSISLAISSPSCNIGVFSDTNLKTCSYSTTVSTNATAGYIGYIKEDQDLQTTTGDVIKDVVDSAVTPGGTGSDEEYGVSTSDSAQEISENNTGLTCAQLDSQSATAMPATALTTSEQSFVSSSAPVDGEVITLCHAVAITSLTEAGTYSHTITITVVGNF